MNPAYHHQAPAPAMVEVRHKPYMSVLFLIAGSIGLVLGPLSLFTGRSLYGVWLLIGPVFLAMGVMTRIKPFVAYDVGRANLYLYSPLGYRVRTFGAARGERIVFDGANVLRLAADGSTKRVNVSSGRPEDLGRLCQTLWALQQGPGR